jgi:hypothetical protein
MEFYASLSSPNSKRERGLNVRRLMSNSQKPRKGEAPVGEETAFPVDWPVPWETGAPTPFVLAADRTFLTYYASKIMPDYDKSRVKLIGEVDPEKLVALVEFLACYDLKFGGPNDEVFHGHPYMVKGLSFTVAIAHSGAKSF